MADLAMKTSGATKAAVRTVEPLTDYATRKGKTSPLLTGHVSSTNNKMTNGDRTWDTRLTKRLRRQTKAIKPNKKNPINPLTPAYGGHLEWVLSLTVGLGGISLARGCFSFGASVE